MKVLFSFSGLLHTAGYMSSGTGILCALYSRETSFNNALSLSCFIEWEIGASPNQSALLGVTVSVSSRDLTLKD
jgi:hypothetical protein